jgi:hypothetical protein
VGIRRRETMISSLLSLIQSIRMVLPIIFIIGLIMMFGVCIALLIRQETLDKPCPYCGDHFRTGEERIPETRTVAEHGAVARVKSYYHPECYQEHKREEKIKADRLHEWRYSSRPRR